MPMMICNCDILVVKAKYLKSLLGYVGNNYCKKNNTVYFVTFYKLYIVNSC